MRTLAIIVVLLVLAGCAGAATTQRIQPRPACTSIGTTMYCQ